MNLFKTHLKNIVIEDSLLLNPESQVQNLPKCSLVVLSAKFAGDFGSALGVLELLGFNKPYLTRIKKGNLSLNLKQGEVVGCKISLRKDFIYSFLERLIIEILPSNKKFSLLKIQKNCLHIHLSDVFVLDDINNHYMYLQGLRTLDIVIQTKNANSKFYQALRFPITDE